MSFTLRIVGLYASIISLFCAEIFFVREYLHKPISLVSACFFGGMILLAFLTLGLAYAVIAYWQKKG